MVKHAAESFDLTDTDANRGLPTRKAAEEFTCECGMVFSVMTPQEDLNYHRSHYHQYCGYCKREPCTCIFDAHGNRL